jgi:hypothetical protein
MWMKNIFSPREAQKEYFEGAITLDKLYGLIRRGEVPHFRLGGKIFLRREVLESWIAEQEIKSTRRGEVR